MFCSVAITTGKNKYPDMLQDPADWNVDSSELWLYWSIMIVNVEGNLGYIPFGLCLWVTLESFKNL